MAELTFKSPGVSTKEIDLSGPTAIAPSGVPAGIIGTANQGPAFVPVTVATFADYMTIFGKTDGEKFGPLAMNEWMKNANAGTYLRVLGVGDGKKRLDSNARDSNEEFVPAGGVKNSGFTVGTTQVKEATGLLASNPYAAALGAGGRTYFLGAFMSESNGSRIFSDAGIQFIENETAAGTVQFNNGGAGGYHQTVIRITDTHGTAIDYKFKNDATLTNGQAGTGLDDGTTIVELNSAASKADFLTLFAAAFNGTNGHGSSGLATMTISDDGVDTSTVTQVKGGPNGNNTISYVGSPSTPSTPTLSGMTGGSGGAVPIIRGVILAASGVIPTLSGNLNNNANTASVGPMKTEYNQNFTAANIGGTPFGSITAGGSSATSTYNFKVLLNGHQISAEYPNELDCSLNPEKSNYITNVLNTDPSKLQSAGHVLYTHYDIQTQQAVITGSGLGSYANYRVAGKEEVVFLMSSSLGRNQNDSGTTAKPNYENFNDRFRHAFSPSVISQEIGGKNKDLFTVHALDAGAFTNTNLKVSIENIRKSKQDDAYGSFDLIVRQFEDDDSGVALIETGEAFRGLNLDPNSNDYIARRIGTINTFYDFDKSQASQKIVVDGVFPNMSRYIRVSMNSEVDAAEITKTALPVGFRGPHHLVTSGSSIFETNNVPNEATGDGIAAGAFLAAGGDELARLVEPPIPYRLTISDGTGGKKKPNSDYYWGLQTTKVTSVTQPNASRIFNDGIKAFTKYYPMFSTSRQAPFVGNNAGTLDSDGTVYDSDRFNNNLFSLEKIQVHTKSSGDVVDFREWGFAQYRRNGELLAARFMPKKDGTTDQGRFLNVAKDFNDIASFKYYKFTMPVQGGFDGVNIFDKDKAALADVAAKREMDQETQGQTEGPTVATYMKALHVMAEKSDVDIQLLAVPGIRETKITDEAIAKTEERFDALYIMDIEERDVDNLVVTSSIQEISVANTVEDLRGRALDTSFAAAYFPDTIIPDPTTGANVRCPPSVSVIGAMSLNDAVAFPWFAPAGFTRGSLANVFDTTVNFNRPNLDTLYESDINPITQFPGGSDHVIFGQKTLQAAASALDRVNVRRLLIDVRRKVRQVADTFLFEPNRASTLARFSSAVNPILAQVQAQQGVERFRVIIDTTTTTQADIENNTVRGKIFLQPTRAVEFISLDFVVTNNGTEI